MTRPSPLAVECPRCLAPKGRACWASTDWTVLKPREAPHVARVRLAEQKAKEVPK